MYTIYIYEYKYKEGNEEDIVLENISILEKGNSWTKILFIT